MLLSSRHFAECAQSGAGTRSGAADCAHSTKVGYRLSSRWPVTGSSRNSESSPWCALKLKRCESEPAMLENEPVMGGSFQLSWTNFGIELMSVSEWSTEFCFAHGEMTSSGSRGPYPQRPFWPANGGLVTVLPHKPRPL